MLTKYTCILCPNGCEVEANIEGKMVLSIEGAGCPKGTGYVEQELLDPQRNIATSVFVEKGKSALVSVRLTHTIPKHRIFDVMNEIKKLKVTAPVVMHQVVIKNVLGLNSDVIATKNVGI